MPVLNNYYCYHGYIIVIADFMVIKFYDIYVNGTENYFKKFVILVVVCHGEV